MQKSSTTARKNNSLKSPSSRFITLLGALCAAGALNLTKVAAADILWSSAASSAWLTAGNWTGSVLPTATDNAQFGANPTAGTGVGINGNGALVPGSQVLDVGAIEVASARNNVNLLVGNNSTTAGKDMILALKGTTVNGVANTILRNAGAGTTILILTNYQSTGTQTMGVSNFLAGAIIDATSPITISSILSGKGFIKTGAGTLTLSSSSANTYTTDTTIANGTLTIGNDTATLGNGAGTLVLAGGTFFRAGQTTAQTFANPISVTADSVIAGNPTTGSRTIPFSSSSISGSAGTLYVSNTAASGSGALQVRFSGAFTFSRPVVVGKGFSGSFVYLQFYNTAALGDQTWSGLISGNGTLYKNVASGAGGNVILSSGNTYSGGTEIRGGFFGLGTDNALGTGNVLLGYDSNPLGLYAVGAARALTNDIVADVGIVNSTNLQIKGSQNFTHSGRIVITNFMQFTISNSALTTFSGVVTNIGSGGGIAKSGPGTLLLTGTNTFTGSATVAAGRLALGGNGNLINATNLSILDGANLDLSTLNSTLILSNTQTFRSASTNGTGGTLGGSLTLGVSSPLIFAYSNGVPSLTVTGGVFTVGSGNAAAVTVANGGTALPVADYKLVAAGIGGSVAGTAPGSVVLGGNGIAGAGASLVISNSELYLRVTNAPVPPSTPVANVASATNLTTFTASWNSASGADGYRLDVATDNAFTAFVAGYSDRDVGAVTSFLATNLSPASVYYYRVRATNIYGASGNSATISVTTLVAPYVWNAGSGNWSDTASWQYANPPVNGVRVGFTGAGGTAANDLAGLLLNSLTFSNGAGAYTISGNPLVVSNGIVNSSTAIETISAPVTLGAAQTLNAASGPLNVVGPLTNGGFLVTFNAAANSTNSGSIAGSGALVKTGAGSLLLSGANTYTGATTNTAGNLRVSGGSALPETATVSLANTAGVTLTVETDETVGSISGGDSSTIALGANNLTAGGDGTSTTLASAITGTGKLVKTGAGTLTLSKATAYGSSFTLRTEGGTNDLNRGGGSLTGILGAGNRVELAGGTLQMTATAQANFAVSIAGLDVYSDSTLFLNRNSAGTSSQSPTITFPLNFMADAKLSFTYNSQITAGTTTFDGAANTLQGNATLALGAYAITIANPIGESGGSYGFTKTGAGQLNLNSVNTYSGPTTNLQGTIQVNATSTFGNGTGPLVLAGGDILDANTRAGAPIANPIVMTADTTIFGNSTVTDGSFRYFPFSSSSLTTVGGKLTLRNAGASGGPNEFRLRFTGGGFNFTQPIIIGVPADLAGLTTGLHIYNDTNVAAQTFSGNISGTGGIVKSAPIAGSGGVTILSGSNSYAGTTTVSEGLLLVNNTNGSGTSTNTVLVTSGGALGGTGIILGRVTNSFGSTLAPGLGGLDTATLTISNSLGLAGNALFTLNRTNAQNATKVAGLASVRYGGTLTLTNVGDALQAGDTFTLFSSAAYVGAFTNIVLPAIDPSLLWVTNTLSVNGSVSVVLAVVPTSLALVSSANPSGYLDPLNFTGTIAPTNGTGTIKFLTNGVPLSTNNLLLGSAISATVSGLPRGTNLITAIYTGDGLYLPSTNTLSQVVTNHPPVAANTNYSRLAGITTLHINIADLLASRVTDADGDTVTLTGVSNSTNGIGLVNDGIFLHYQNTNAVNDQFSYTVTDSYGDSATGVANIVAAPFGTGQNATVTVSGSTATVGFAGIPGYSYDVQRSTNLTVWINIHNTNAPPTGAFEWTDDFSDLGVVPSSAYYRLQWNP